MNLNMTENKFLQICYTIITIFGTICIEYIFWLIFVDIFFNIATICIFVILTMCALCIMMCIFNEIKVVNFKKEDKGEKE